MNNEDYVTYEIAQTLKKMGFDYPCYFYYTEQDAPNGCVWHTTSEEAPVDYNRSIYAGCSMPTLAQAQKWLISKGVFVEVSCFGSHKLNHDRLSCKEVVDWSYELVNITSGDYIGENLDLFEDYSTCLSAGIAAALKLIEEGEE